ncbi:MULTISPECIES: NAD(+) diphosphatase [unclassified Sphingobium]|uniref:NAD(+) diphosphatase n=1 Tax=unclassified Sphingobium TaxID=2611147 RepID=UPI00222509DE|nr:MULTISPECIES: NAD(+) diphosphatase [unclassified Sphingobium]MCW2395386.1 NAD+ diphosphatase [Sphingobium sp. B8D3B]MCW2418901.1 NAD+ diphosphatase [Sphingobium sp. B8D3C]
MTRPDLPARQAITFTGGTLDRADQLRVHPDRLAGAWADPRARIVQLDGLDPMIEPDGTLASEPVPPGAVLADHALLGLREDGTPVFVSLLVEHSVEPPSFPAKVWDIIPQLTMAEAAHYAAARSLVDWHDRHRFCARCGGDTHPIKAGWARQCSRCSAEHFPRTDPVVIMLAEYRGKVLIGRNPRFPAGRFSALAGFVEPGETIEEAVRRELWEECGVRTGQVDYLFSQPWPFPSQLMVACIAQANDDALTLDEEEIAEAIWVSVDEVRAALAGEEGARFLPPSPIAVAHHMLRYWLESRQTEQPPAA